MCLFACDYSQKEVRILAHMSGDEAMIALFRGDPRVDIYRQMSSVILNKPVDAVTDKERSQFKQITLAILYGMSANQVSTKLCISKVNAQQLMVDFFRRFRGIKTWMDATKAAARSKLCVKTIAGRKRFLDDINSDDNAKRSQAERQVRVVNFGRRKRLMSLSSDFLLHRQSTL
jgi:DNA polymerase-1